MGRIEFNLQTYASRSWEIAEQRAKNARFWYGYAASALAWIAVYLVIAPDMSGVDVYIFRDAGWNLARWGSFSSAGLIGMNDLTPRLYAHYTPMVPLLFAGFLWLFQFKVVSGTIFNLLMALAASAVMLRHVLRQPESRLRNVAALAVALLPVLFITFDRPEALALVFFAASVASASDPNPRLYLTGLWMTVTFLESPFAAVVAAVWATALALKRNLHAPTRWRSTAREVATMGAVALAPLAPIALVYYSLDNRSLARFASHALGLHSGMGRVLSSGSKLGFLQMVVHGALGYGHLEAWHHLMSLGSLLLLVCWALAHRETVDAGAWLAIASCIGSTLIAQFVFPAESRYVTWMAFVIPLGLLAVSRAGEAVTRPALALVLFALFINFPMFAWDLLRQIENGRCYEAARNQPVDFLAHLPSPDAIIAVEGSDYDLYKPLFRHVIQINKYSNDEERYTRLDGVANCYDNYRGDANTLRPLPEQLNAAKFTLVERAPAHLWVTLFGRRINRLQWGYGCDLYVRKWNATEAETAARTTFVQ